MKSGWRVDACTSVCRGNTYFRWQSSLAGVLPFNFCPSMWSRLLQYQQWICFAPPLAFLSIVLAWLYPKSSIWGRTFPIAPTTARTNLTSTDTGKEPTDTNHQAAIAPLPLGSCSAVTRHMLNPAGSRDCAGQEGQCLPNYGTQWVGQDWKVGQPCHYLRASSGT